MSTSLKVAAILIIIAIAVNIFLFFNNDIKRSDVMPNQALDISSVPEPASE
jgi:hypothetical protein